jgi:acyl-CoA synthetase (NDP forming)
VAFIGASPAWQMGSSADDRPSHRRIRGEIYLVNAKGQDIAGRKTYSSVADIPGHVDLGIVTLPASQVRDLIPKFRLGESNTAPLSPDSAR